MLADTALHPLATSMQTRSHLNALLLFLLFGTATAAGAQVQPELAKRYFEEASKLCERDAGRLWGVSLCGPMVIFDPATGARATSQPEPEGPPPRFPGFAHLWCTGRPRPRGKHR
jgi:hypothetical protein